MYEFYESHFYSKRLIVDYLIESKIFVFIDWSETRNLWKYGTIQWKEVENDQSILSLYPQLYNSDTTYEEVIVRKAILTEIDQY